jgi:hypothetical protein
MDGVCCLKCSFIDFFPSDNRVEDPKERLSGRADSHVPSFLQGFILLASAIGLPTPAVIRGVGSRDQTAGDTTFPYSPDPDGCLQLSFLEWV